MHGPARIPSSNAVSQDAKPGWVRFKRKPEVGAMSTPGDSAKIMKHAISYYFSVGTERTNSSTRAGPNARGAQDVS